MNTDFFFKFSKFRLGRLTAAEDFADKMNYQVTTFLMFVFMAVVGIRQYLFTAIKCWIPPEWNRGWEEYTDNYCWVQDTYFYPVITGPSLNVQERRHHSIGYYQWIPFILLIQIVLYYLPHLLWKQGSSRIGGNVSQLIRFAGDVPLLDVDKRKKTIEHLAKYVGKLLDTRRKWRAPRAQESASRVRRKLGAAETFAQKYLPCWWFGKRSGFYLISFYFAIKALYIAVSIFQMVLMRHFLGFRHWTFGFELLHNLAHQQEWEQTGMFPRVTYCDVLLRKLGNMQRFTVQCVLPVNMVIEKVYIFLWFWVMLTLTVTIISMVAWIFKTFMRSNRQEFVRKYLKVSKEIRKSDKPYVKLFIDRYLNQDGVFLLQMIAHNVGDMLTAELMQKIWKNWLDEYKKSIYEKLKPPTGLPNGVQPVAGTEEPSKMYPKLPMFV